MRKDICKPVPNSPLVALFLLVASAVALAAITACAPKLSVPPSKVIEANMMMVEGCKYVGEVHGSSAVSNMLVGWRTAADSIQIGIQNAKYEALQEAQSLGATHVVWTSETRSFDPKVTGHAYHCD